MPELPEVETIKLGLKKKIIGLKIKQITVLNPKSFQADVKLLNNKKILNINRLAKVLCIDLVGDISLLIHLKMSGQLVLVNSSKLKVQSEERLIGGHPTKDMMSFDLPNKSTRVIFELENYTLPAQRYTLFFNDQRKFGWIKLVESSKLKVQSYIKDLGPEPLEKSFTWQVLKRQLQKRLKTPVKVAIMDQQIISGIGNIYASEACFIAKIDPRTKVLKLTDDQHKKLHLGIVKSLSDGIKYGGSTKTHFVNSDGRKGVFLDHAFVYNKDKTPCKICKTIIKKIKLGGRGTYFCPKCQPQLA